MVHATGHNTVRIGLVDHAQDQLGDVVSSSFRASQPIVAGDAHGEVSQPRPPR
jgi:glycine cleavage system H lipoate-binding protein